MLRETPEQRFKRIAEKRTLRVLKELELLSQCGNSHNYKYSEEQVNKIFDAITQQLEESRNKFVVKRSREFKL